MQWNAFPYQEQFHISPRVYFILPNKKPTRFVLVGFVPLMRRQGHVERTNIIHQQMIGRGNNVNKLAKMSDESWFTPVSDRITKELGMYPALVYGKIWRYNQMKDGVCRASKIRMAEELGISDDSVGDSMTILEDAGYIVDKTPELRNRPHIVLITDKDPFSSYTNSGSGYTNSGSQLHKQRHEDSNKKVNKNRRYAPPFQYISPKPGL